MLRPDGFVKVLDFGLAKLASAVSNQAGTESTHTVLRTDAGIVVGTVAYMSPEQARGQDVDARTDIWSLAVTLYEMVAGRSPFAEHSTSETLVAILDREPDPLARFESTTAPEFQRILTKALRKERSQRYQGMQDLLLDLQAHREELDLQAQMRVRVAPRAGAPAGDESVLSDRAAATVCSRPFRKHLVAQAGRRFLVWIAIALMAIVAMAAIAWWTTLPDRSSGSLPLRDSTLTRVTANSSEYSVLSAVISPDGKFVAYSDPRGIQLRAIDSGETQLLPDTAGLRVTRWTLDGTKVVGSKTLGEDARAYEISILGGAPRRPCSIATPSPDGSQLLTEKKPGELWVGLSDGAPRRIDHLANNEIARNPNWTWDSQRIAYVRRAENGSTAIEEIDVARGTEHVLLGYSENGVAFDLPTPLPDGRVLFVTYDWHAHTVSLSAIQKASQSGTTVSEPQRIKVWSDADTNSVDALSVTRDGRRVAFMRGNTRLQIYVSRLHRANTVLETPRRLTSDVWSNVPTAWTTDSLSVLFSSDRQGGLDIFKQRIDSDSAEALVTGPDLKSNPRTTPDGKWVLFVSQPKKIAARPLFRLWRSPIDGGASEEVLSAREYPLVRCAAQGPCIIVRSEGKQEIVALLNPLDGSSRQLFRTTGATNHAISSDGQHIAYLLPGGRIRIVSAIGGALEQELTVPTALILEALDWAADGTGLFVGDGAWAQGARLLFVGRNGATDVLWRQPFGPFAVVPSPDGKYLAMPIYASDSNVWMLEGF